MARKARACGAREPGPGAPWRGGGPAASRGSACRGPRGPPGTVPRVRCRGERRGRAPPGRAPLLGAQQPPALPRPPAGPRPRGAAGAGAGAGESGVPCSKKDLGGGGGGCAVAAPESLQPAAEFLCISSSRARRARCSRCKAFPFFLVSTHSLVVERFVYPDRMSSGLALILQIIHLQLRTLSL